MFKRTSTLNYCPIIVNSNLGEREFKFKGCWYDILKISYTKFGLLNIKIYLICFIK